MPITPAVDVQFAAMGKAEAKRAVEDIKNNLDSAGRLAIELRRREGWRALGYSSWPECAVEEFGRSLGQIQRQINAEEIRPFISAPGREELNQNIPEKVLRPLTSIRDEPKLIPEAWNLAKEQSNGRPTQEHVQRAVDAVLERHSLAVPKTKVSGYGVIRKCIDDFLITVASVNAPDTPEQRGWGGFPVVAERFTPLERREINNYLASLVDSVQEWIEVLEDL